MRLLHAASATVALSLAGCYADEQCECSPCNPAAVLRVIDAPSGAPVQLAAASGGGAIWTCEVTGGDTLCSGRPTPALPFDVTVSAVGHATGTRHVEPVLFGGSCCPDCWGFPVVTVALDPV
jgi:hypothetical protein